MTDETEAAHLRGLINGFLFGIASRADTPFEDAQWESHYGSVITHCSFPTYPSMKARRNGERELVLGTYNHETGESILSADSDFPDDRPGAVVFDDGVAVIRTNWGDNYCVNLSPLEHGIVGFLSERHLQAVRRSHQRVEGDKRGAWDK
jgi:hypothetical protein